MSVEKTVIRSHVFNEIGNRTDDLLERYRAELKEAEGAMTGIAYAGKAIEALLAQVDQDIDAHRLDLEQGKLAKSWVLRSMQALTSLQTQASAKTYVCKGRVEAMQAQVQTLKQLYDVEKARLAQYTAPPTADNVVPIDGRERPLPLKARRLQGEEPAPTEKKKRGRKPKPRPTEDGNIQSPAQSQTGHMPPGPYTGQPVSTEESS